MPIFEYSCDQCGGRFAVLVGVVSEASVTKCPTCDGESLTKLVSRFSYARSDDFGGDDFDDPYEREMMDYASDELGDDVAQDIERMIES